MPLFDLKLLFNFFFFGEDKFTVLLLTTANVASSKVNFTFQTFTCWMP